MLDRFDKKKLLVTGGSGYIGSHSCIELIKAGHELIVMDNLSNSSKDSIAAVERLVEKKIEFIVGDIRSKKDVRSIFNKYEIYGSPSFCWFKISK